MKTQWTISQQEVGISARHPISIRNWRTERKTIRPHDHAYNEIALCVGGSAWHLTGDRRDKIGPGSLLVCAPGQVHSFEISGWLELFNIFYLAEWVFHDLQDYWEQPQLCMLFCASLLYQEQAVEPVKTMTLPEDCYRAVHRECQDLALAVANPSVSHLYLRATFEKILALAGASVEIRNDGRRPDIWQCMCRIENMIQSGEAFDQDTFARGAPVQAAHLSRLFCRETGKSPMEFYQQRRSQIACVRLLNPLLSITDIAMELGYADAAHFSRNFRRYYRVSPREFRRQQGVTRRHGNAHRE